MSDFDSGLPSRSHFRATPVVETPSTLPELFAARGVTSQQVAQAIGVDPLLLERIVNGRQSLAIDLVGPMAVYLGVSRGDVEGCAGSIGLQTGPRAHIALPPEPLLGERFPTFLLAETVNTPIDTGGGAPSVGVWVCGENLAGDANLPGVLKINRITGVIELRTALPTTGTPTELATDGATIFTAASTAISGAYSLARLLPATGALLGETPNANLNSSSGVVYEPVSGTLWVCSFALSQLVKIDRSTGAVLGVVHLSSAGDDYSPVDVVAANGKLYVGASYFPPFGANTGRVFEVDPVAGTVLRISTGVNMQFVWGVATDGTNLWVTSSVLSPNVAKISQMTLAGLIASAVTITADPLVITNPSWIDFFFGAYWITDLTGSGMRLVAVDPSGAVLQSRVFGGFTGGHCASDGAFIWYADTAAGQVHVLDSMDIATSHVVVSTFGAPNGLLVL